MYCALFKPAIDGTGWRDGALGATPGQLRNGPTVPAASPASRVLCTAQLDVPTSRRRPGVPARFSETAMERDNEKYEANA